MQREVLVEGAVGHLASCLYDQIGEPPVELPELGVGQRGRFFQNADGPQERPGHRVVAYREVDERPRCLGTPVAVGGDLDRSHGIGLDTYHAHHTTPCSASSASSAGPLVAHGSRDEEDLASRSQVGEGANSRR